MSYSGARVPLVWRLANGLLQEEVLAIEQLAVWKAEERIFLYGIQLYKLDSC